MSGGSTPGSDEMRGVKTSINIPGTVTRDPTRQQPGGVTQSNKETTYDVAGLTEGLLLHGVERLAAQLAAAGHADEAVHVEDLVHGGAAGAFTHHVLSAAGAAPWGEGTPSRSNE